MTDKDGNYFNESNIFNEIELDIDDLINGCKDDKGCTTNESEEQSELDMMIQEELIKENNNEDENEHILAQELEKLNIFDEEVAEQAKASELSNHDQKQNYCMFDKQSKNLIGKDKTIRSYVKVRRNSQKIDFLEKEDAVVLFDDVDALED